MDSRYFGSRIFLPVVVVAESDEDANSKSRRRWDRKVGKVRVAFLFMSSHTYGA